MMSLKHAIRPRSLFEPFWVRTTKCLCITAKFIKVGVKMSISKPRFIKWFESFKAAPVFFKGAEIIEKLALKLTINRKGKKYRDSINGFEILLPDLINTY